MIRFDSFANYASALKASVSNMNVLIPASYSSLKTLFIIMRHSSNLSDYAKSSISERSNIIGDTGT